MDSPTQPNEPRPMIRLDDFLKKAGLVATGGEAKILIQGGEVVVNDEVETRRRRQLHAGDEVLFDGEIWTVDWDGDDD